MTFDFLFPRQYLKSSLLVSLLSVWVLVGLFVYLNHYTKRQYFTIWTVAWLFYALWLTLNLNFETNAPSTLVFMLKDWCISVSAMFLLWGSLRFMGRHARQRQLGLYVVFLFIWSWAGTHLVTNPLYLEWPVFAMLGLASGITGANFLKYRRKRSYIAASLLALGFILWGIVLAAYPLIQAMEDLVSAGFYIMAIIQLLIAVSMIILVLEQMRFMNHRRMAREIRERELMAVNLKLKEALARAELMAAEAASANRAKSQFLAAMSHEIRTPMSGVLSMMQLLQSTPLNEEQQDIADTVQGSAEVLINILSDILDFSKIEAGKLTLECVDFNLRELVESSWKLMRQSAQAKRLKLRLEMADPIFVDVRGDGCRLQQILMNLLSNAIKFTARGEISLRIDQLVVSDQQVQYRFAVRDTGLGIKPEAKSQLFQPFVQAEASTTRRYGGTGLGLAICRQLVELMGGRIEVDSEVNQGSRFWFELSLEKGQPVNRVRNLSPIPRPASSGDSPSSFPLLCPATRASSLGNRPAASAKAPACGLRVLVVEDNLINQKVALMQLKKLGCEGEVVSNGLEALNKLQNDPFDVVLMDCLMPEMDGFETTRRIRQMPHLTGIKVVALTANEQDGYREQCLSSGMDDYISKPANLEKLQRVMNRQLRVFA